jgi:Tol biopolymer transport system component
MWEPGMEDYPNVSPDGGSFLYVAGPEGKKDIYLRRVGGENATNLTGGFPGNDTQPAFSPDGKEIAFATRAFSHSGGGRSELWVVRVASGARRKLYDGDGRTPSWSPSGSRIAFDQGRYGNSPDAQRGVSTIPAAGGAPTAVVNVDAAVWTNPDWTRGGITFDSMAGGTLGIWRIAVDEATGASLGESVPLLTSVTDTIRSSSSADGRRVLFAAAVGSFAIDRFDFDPARGKLAGERQVVLSGPRDLRPQNLAPDGEWLATILLDRNHRHDILLVRVRTGETRRLTDDAPRKYALRWAPDGSKLYFCVAPEGVEEVWSIRPDGSERQREVRSAGEGGVRPLAASPDGRTLYVSVGKDGLPHTVDLADAPDARRPVPLPPPPGGRRFEPSFMSPDGRWLAGRAVDPNAPPDRDPRTLYDAQERTYTELPAPPTASLCGFLPDSRRLLFFRPGQLEVLDRVTGTLAPAGSLETTWLSTPFWLSRDGRSLYGSRARSEFDIWMLDTRAAR